jgi:septal ring-binding cell division protein DamX
LLLGIYPNKSAAEKAASDWIAAKNLKVKPWIRPLGPLQDAIREAVEG